MGFFYALDADLAALREEAGGVGRAAKAGGTAVEVLELGEHRVVAAEMGAGGVVTAVTVASVLAKYPCDVVVSVAPVGALDSELGVGGWFLVERVVGYQRGTENAGGFALAKSATFEMALPDWLGLLDLPRISVASGEVFSASDAFRDELREMSGAEAIDMNLYGLLVACRSFGVPVVALRVVSDRAGDAAGKEFGRFLRDYDGEGGRRVAKRVRAMPPNPERPESYDGSREVSEGE